MGKRFVTIFPGLRPQHLGKDVAQIPARMNCFEDYEAELWTTDEGQEFKDASPYAGDLPIRQLPDKGKIGSLEKAFLKRIRQEARHIDVLHLIGYERINFFYGFHYKLRNPKGTLYLKGDIYNQQLKERTAIQTRKAWKKKAIRHLERRFLKALDLISLENEKASPIFKSLFPEHAEKCIQLPNGIDAAFLRSRFPEPTPWEEKEDVFLVVGRIGISSKNHEQLLKALEDLELGHWKVRFIGPIEESFEGVRREFFLKAPDKEGQVEFLGPIRDQRALFQEHEKAKVQLIPSRIESFGHVLLEGGAFDQYIVGSTGILPFDEITQGKRFGCALEPDNKKALKATIESIIADPATYRIPPGAFREHVLQHFSWEGVIEQLKEALEKKGPGDQR
ncbi:MAG: glycosyltransferase family 4 protein [Flavobacteriales bacterium]